MVQQMMIVEEDQRKIDPPAQAAVLAAGGDGGASVPAADAVASPPEVDLSGVRLAKVTEPQCVRWVMEELKAGRGGWLVTPNLDIMRRLTRDRSFRELIAGATLKVADGMPLVWASHLQGTPLPQRVCGSNLILSLSRAAAQCGRSVFLLGGDKGTAESAAGVLRQRFEGLRVAGTYYPPRGFEDDERQMAALAEAVRNARPDIIYVALGCPKQEQLIRRLRRELPRSWWVGVGISFSFVSGEVRRAPGWMQRAGLEWMHRLSQEPQRLIRRYVLDDIPFAIMLFGASLRRRWTKQAAER